MKKVVTFAKVQATGNDFIVLNNRDLALDRLTPNLVQKWCDRHFGVGGDGLIHVSLDDVTVPRMKFFNADGSSAAMCGNGLRAVVKYLITIGVCERKHENRMMADDGQHAFIVDEEGHISVELKIDEQAGKQPNLEDLEIPTPLELLGFKVVGVPHLVFKTVHEEIQNFEALGRQFRWHPVFAPTGTNVNLIDVLNDHVIRVRTYERGVEAETLSCGTGVTASALLYWQKFPQKERKLTIQTKGGILKVEERSGRIFLTGPAHIVFIGQLVLDE